MANGNGREIDTIDFTLTQGEELRLHELEHAIGASLRTFVDVGRALLEIRDSRLYRREYATFEDYCRDRWGFNRNYANKIIIAAETVDNLGTIVPILPATESQTRPLTVLDPDQQRAAWQQAIDTAPNGRVTAAHVQGIVRSLYPGAFDTKRQAPNGDTPEVDDDDSIETITMRAAFLGFYMALGWTPKTREIAERFGMSDGGAWDLVTHASGIIPIQQDEELRWVVVWGVNVKRPHYVCQA